MGYISNSIYSSNFIENDYLWLVNWIVDKKYKYLSLSLLNYIITKLKYSFIGTLGCSEGTLQILKALGFKTGKLKHLACVNPRVSKFSLCNFTKKNKKKIIYKSKYRLRVLYKKNISIFFNDIQEINSKDKQYFIKRYCEHPIYKYDFLGFWKLKKPYGFFVGRQINCGNSFSYKLVDYHGKKIDLKDIFYLLNNCNKTFKYEFYDLYNFSKKNFFKNSNNFNVKKNIIAPNFFKPFVFKNIKIRFAYHSKDVGYLPFFVRGDCDQDRPN